MHAHTCIAALKRFAGLRSVCSAEAGQDLLEYGLLSALIALVAFGAVTAVGNSIHTVFWQSIATNF